MSHLQLLIGFLLIQLTSSAVEVVAAGANTRSLEDQLTIRVNTFRRLDLIEYFLEYYSTCDVVAQVQVVWSDQQNKPPIHWGPYPPNKVLFEVHPKDSLSNRFRPQQFVPTQAVLSIDDDLIVSCADLGRSLDVWKANTGVLVGFSPRMTAFNILTGGLRYLKWQHTWWSGVYSVMLTKAALLHRDYLPDYDKLIPQEMLEHIDKGRNCEDIAMAHVVAKESGAAPVWVSVVVFEVSTGGISSGSSHFVDRSGCLDKLSLLTGSTPWVTGYQKSVPVSYLDAVWFWWSDTK